MSVHMSVSFMIPAHACDVCGRTLSHSIHDEPWDAPWDDDAVRREVRGCPAPLDQDRRWYVCAECPDSDFCAAHKDVHEHQCVPGPCHDCSNALCGNCCVSGLYSSEDEWSSHNSDDERD